MLNTSSRVRFGSRVSGKWVVIGLSVSFVSVFFLASLSAQENAAEDDLIRKQENLRKVTVDARARMTGLAKRLRESTLEAEDAKRLDSAVEMFKRALLEDTLNDAAGALGKSEYLDAVLKQDLAIETIDSIIRLLEERQFDGAALQEKIDNVRELKEEAKRLAQKQRNLLEKTREAIDLSQNAQELKEIAENIDSVSQKQKQAMDGQDPDKIDPTLGQKDAGMISKLQQAVQQLTQAQSKWNEEAGKLEPKKLPIESTEQFLSQLQKALQKAESLVKLTERLENADSSARADSNAQSSDSDTAKSPGDKSQSLQKDSSGRKSEAAASDKQGTDDKSNDDASSSDSKTPSAPKTDDPADGTDKTGEPLKDGKADPLKSATTREKSASSAAELSRVSGAAKDLAQQLGDELKELQTTPVEELPKDAQKGVREAQSESQQVPSALEEQQYDKAHDKSKTAAEALRQARDAVAQKLAQMREQNALQTAGLSQQEALLEQATQKASQTAQEGAQQSQSKPAQDTMQNAAGELNQAAKAMKQATDSLQKGDRAEAQKAGQQAESHLKAAKEKLDSGQESIENRTAEQKASDLQNELARKTKSAEDKIRSMLQKKVRKKADKERLAQAQAELAKARNAMERAAEAAKKGESAELQKKQKDALSSLQRAKDAVKEEEEDQLDRLQRRNLSEDAKQQDELASLTRETAKDAAKRSSSQSSSQGEKMESAAQNMEQASQNLQQDEPKSAEEKQEEALEQLQNVASELEQEEEQLAKLKREEEIVNVIDELKGLKEGEEEIFSMTVELHEQVEKRSRSRRAQALLRKRVTTLANQQNELTEKATGLTGRLTEQSSRVFSFVLGNITSDMKEIEANLRDRKTGAYTQLLEREVGASLQRLITAMEGELDRMQKQEPRQQTRDAPPGGQQKQRLVSMMAELLMLKDLQTGVNQQTGNLEDLREASDDGPSESWERALERLALRQGSVTDMLKTVIEDFKAAGGEDAGESSTDESGAEDEKGQKKPEKAPEGR